MAESLFAKLALGCAAIRHSPPSDRVRVHQLSADDDEVPPSVSGIAPIVQGQLSAERRRAAPHDRSRKSAGPTEPPLVAATRAQATDASNKRAAQAKSGSTQPSPAVSRYSETRVSAQTADTASTGMPPNLAQGDNARYLEIAEIRLSWVIAILRAPQGSRAPLITLAAKALSVTPSAVYQLVYAFDPPPSNRFDDPQALAAAATKDAEIRGACVGVLSLPISKALKNRILSGLRCGGFLRNTRPLEFRRPNCRLPSSCQGRVDFWAQLFENMATS
jgi:hypothetical protein